MLTWQIGEADDNYDVHQEDIRQVDSNAQPDPPVHVGHVQPVQDTVPQSQVLVRGVGVLLVLPVTCGQSTACKQCTSATMLTELAHQGSDPDQLTESDH